MWVGEREREQSELPVILQVKNSKADLLQTNKELPVYMDLPLHD